MSIGLWAQVAVLLMDCYIGLLGQVIYRLCIWVELPVQRRLCPIFVREVRSPDIHGGQPPVVKEEEIEVVTSSARKIRCKGSSPKRRS